MKFTPEYFVSGLFIVAGLLALIFKPFYEDDKRINLIKASIYQGWAILTFGLFLFFLKIVLSFIGLSAWWPLGLFVGVIALVIIMFRLKKVCYIKDESENLTFSLGVQQKKAEITKRYVVIFAIGLTVFIFTSMIIRPSIKIVDNKFKVGGGFGFEYPISYITEIDTLQGYPGVDLMTGGSGFAGIYKGSFKLQGYGQGRLFLKKGIRPYLYIKFKNNDFVFLNLKSSKQTIEFYNELITKTKY
jgi:Ca2+/Na+ antiporter